MDKTFQKALNEVVKKILSQPRIVINPLEPLIEHRKGLRGLTQSH